MRYQVDDGVEALQLTVNDDLKFFLVVQVGQQLDEGGFGEAVQVDGGHLPVALRRRVQDLLQYRQTWMTEGICTCCAPASQSAAVTGRAQMVETMCKTQQLQLVRPF